MKSQEQHWLESHRKQAKMNELFLLFVQDGMTADELRKNIDRRPQVWGRYEKWLRVLPAGRMRVI